MSKVKQLLQKKVAKSKTPPRLRRGGALPVVHTWIYLSFKNLPGNLYGISFLRKEYYPRYRLLGIL